MYKPPFIYINYRSMFSKMKKRINTSAYKKGLSCGKAHKPLTLYYKKEIPKPIILQK